MYHRPRERTLSAHRILRRIRAACDYLFSRRHSGLAASPSIEEERTFNYIYELLLELGRRMRNAAVAKRVIDELTLIADELKLLVDEQFEWAWRQLIATIRRLNAFYLNTNGYQLETNRKE